MSGYTTCASCVLTVSHLSSSEICLPSSPVCEPRANRLKRHTLPLSCFPFHACVGSPQSLISPVPIFGLRCPFLVLRTIASKYKSASSLLVDLLHCARAIPFTTLRVVNHQKVDFSFQGITRELEMEMPQIPHGICPDIKKQQPSLYGQTIQTFLIYFPFT